MVKYPWEQHLTEPLGKQSKELIKAVGRTINTYSMIGSGDTVLLSASGGKDSLVLALALSLRKRWLPIDYTLKALLINWEEYPIPSDQIGELSAYFRFLGYSFAVVTQKQEPASFSGAFNCYLCARNRRRILFDRCKEESIRLVALGHHLDDLVETSMINLAHRGTFTTMLPVQPFFDGELSIIRPMIQIPEEQIAELALALQLPVVKPPCPYDQSTLRMRIKPIIADLVALDPAARNHIYRAHRFNMPEDIQAITPLYNIDSARENTQE